MKETFPGNGRFHVTLDPDVSEEDLKRMKNAAQRKKSRFARRTDVADLAEGQEMLGAVVRVRVVFSIRPFDLSGLCGRALDRGYAGGPSLLVLSH